jgi:hypothetical protein
LAFHHHLAASVVTGVLYALGCRTDVNTSVRRGACAYLDFQWKGGSAPHVFGRLAAVVEESVNASQKAVCEPLIDLPVMQTERTSGLVTHRVVYRGLLLGIEAVVLHKQCGGTLSVADRGFVARFGEPWLPGVIRSARSWARPVA